MELELQTPNKMQAWVMLLAQEVGAWRQKRQQQQVPAGVAETGTGNQAAVIKNIFSKSKYCLKGQMYLLCHM